MKINLGTVEWNDLLLKIKNNEPSLSLLDLSENQLGDTAIKELSEVLKVNHVITHLNLAQNNLGPAGAKYLGEVLKVNKTIQSLELQSNLIGDDGVGYLSKALTSNHSVKALNLNFTNLNAKGARFLSEALMGNDTLQFLSLALNMIGDDGAKCFSNALEVNDILRSLNLGSNWIEADGVKYLGEALEVNKGLLSLDLSGNNIGFEGIKDLSGALHFNGVLKTLILTATGIGNAEVIKLSNALKVNRGITLLDLNYNDISGTVTITLDKVFETNFTMQYLVLPTQKLVDHIEPVLQRNRKLFGQLQQAIQLNHLAQIQELVAQGVSLLAQDEELNTPLHWAVNSHSTQVVKWLLATMREQQLPLTIENKAGKTAQNLAQTNPEMMELFKAAMSSTYQFYSLLSVKDDICSQKSDEIFEKKMVGVAQQVQHLIVSSPFMQVAAEPNQSKELTEVPQPIGASQILFRQG